MLRINFKDSGQSSAGPTEVAAQSKSRTRAHISRAWGHRSAISSRQWRIDHPPQSSAKTPVSGKSSIGARKDIELRA